MFISLPMSHGSCCLLYMASLLMSAFISWSYVGFLRTNHCTLTVKLKAFLVRLQSSSGSNMTREEICMNASSLPLKKSLLLLFWCACLQGTTQTWMPLLSNRSSWSLPLCLDNLVGHRSYFSHPTQWSLPSLVPTLLCLLTAHLSHYAPRLVSQLCYFHILWSPASLHFRLLTHECS